MSSASIDEQMRTKAKTAVMGVPECNFALLNNPPTWSKMQTELRTSVAIAERSGKSVDQFVGEVEKMNDEYDQHFVDRTYQGGGRNGGRRDNRNRSFAPGADRSSSQSSSGSWQPRSGGSSYQKKCYVCKKVGCWSKNHPIQEREEAFQRFRSMAPNRNNRKRFQHFLIEAEGYEGDEYDLHEEEAIQLLAEIDEFV